MKEIYQIFDKAFKRILTLSNKAVINLINGLFDTNYPLDSKINYNWTEHEDKELKKTLSDSILTINGQDSYHMEAQMTEDEEIVFRVFEYGFGHAYKNRIIGPDGEIMEFPQPCIIYLDEGKKDKIPDEYNLILQFKDQGEFSYMVPVFKLQNKSTQELNDKKLIALLPFLLLKLRKKIEIIRSKENVEELKGVILYDIIETIRKNKEVGNISYTDALDLIDLTRKLYMQLYSKYEELGEVTMRLYDQSMELESDKYEHTVEELEEMIKERDGAIQKRDERLQEYGEAIQERDERLHGYEETIKEQKELIRELKTRLKNAGVHYETI